MAEMKKTLKLYHRSHYFLHLKSFFLKENHSTLRIVIKTLNNSTSLSYCEKK